MKGFTTHLLDEIKNSPDYIQGFIDRLKREDYICIWGTGIAGQMIHTATNRCGIHVDCFVDGIMKTNTNKTLMNTPIIKPEGIPSNAFIVIAADVKYGIHQRIKGNSYCYIDPQLLNQFQKDTKEHTMEKVFEARKSIDTVYEKLSDDRSRQTFRNVLIHRMVHRLDLLWDVLEVHQYFNNDVVHIAPGDFVDCGAYTGDTLRAFLAQSAETSYQYHAFEPERENFSVLQKYVSANHLDNVHLHEIGIWNKEACLSFLNNQSNDSLAWKLVERDDGTDSDIRVNSLDNMLKGIKISFIKMDIEGAELKALEGSEKCIKRWNPILAISAYHKLDHFWNVPLKILELNPNYKMYYRHHSWNMADTVCYGI